MRTLMGLIGVMLILLVIILFFGICKTCLGFDASKAIGKKSEPGERFAPAPIETPYGVYDNTEMKKYFQRGRDPFIRPRGEK